MTIEVWFHFQTYDSFGGDKNLSAIAHVLERHSATLDPALRSVELTACFRTKRPPRKTLEPLYEQFHAGLHRLPVVTYSPKKGKLSITFASNPGTAEEVLWTYKLNHELFSAAFRELEQVAGTLEPTLKANRGLDAHRLLAWIRNARAGAPASQRQLEIFEVEEERRRAEDRATMSEWDLLAIDWDEYHPNARNLLDDPFFWEGANDFAPNGNDTGADLLSSIRDERRAHRQPLAFLREIFQQWGMAEAIDLALAKDVELWTEQDEIAIVAHDEAAIALPFGLIKVYGAADASAVKLALDAIERQRSAALPRNWPVSQERADAFLKIEQKLREWIDG